MAPASVATVFWRSWSAASLVMLVERFDRLAQHIRVVDEIVLDESAQFLLLRRRELVGARGSGEKGGSGERGGEAKGGDQLHATLQTAAPGLGPAARFVIGGL